MFTMMCAVRLLRLESSMTTWLIGAAAYLGATWLFVILWSRALPPAENMSRTISRVERERRGPGAPIS